MLPKIIDEDVNQNPENIQKDTEAVDNSFKELLQSLRHDQTPNIRKRRTKVNVKPGKIISVEDFVEDDENPQTSHSTGQNSGTSGTKQVQPKKSRKRVEISSEDEDDFLVCYICKVAGLEDDNFVGKFLKRVPQTNKFTITEEESLVSRNDVILKLSSPVSSSSARFKDMLFFKDDLSDFTIY
ncbi:hypothetical protein WA026_019644 [Henosepilachna vigintioctopunctata]|uniref:Uncharacterized protein n=1 Tax=Henosepilachna vigintioctopunctata TaxID=420089 RepID=A0AAW1TYB9_9CUCU